MQETFCFDLYPTNTKTKYLRS